MGFVSGDDPLNKTDASGDLRIGSQLPVVKDRIPGGEEPSAVGVDRDAAVPVGVSGQRNEQYFVRQPDQRANRLESVPRFATGFCVSREVGAMRPHRGPVANARLESFAGGRGLQLVCVDVDRSPGKVRQAADVVEIEMGLHDVVEATIFRAIGQLSRVTLDRDAVNVDGRRALALGRLEEGWLSDEILLDPNTFELIGERSIAIADHTSTALDGTTTVNKGTLENQLVRTAAAIVDKPGQTH